MSELYGRLILRTWRWRAGLTKAGRRTRRRSAGEGGEAPKRVLVVTPFPIHPVIHGGAVRISNLIRRAARFTEVWLLVLGEATDDEEHRRAYSDCCRQVLFHRLGAGVSPADDPHGLMPPSAAPYASRTLGDRISALVDAHRIDVVQLEFAELAAQVGRRDGARTVLVEHDLGFTTQSRQRALGVAARFDAGSRIGDDPLDGLRQERFELAACTAADQVHCMSDHDRRVLSDRLADPGHVEVIANGVDLEAYRPGPAGGRRGALFLGSFPHLPNLDAFEHLVEDVWPAVRRRKPDAELTIAGARPPDAVLARGGSDGIRVAGEVAEAAPLYLGHRVLVVPLRAGSGTRLKILEALSCGLPVVSTTIGVEGLELSDHPEVVVADDPEAMAEAVAALLDSPDDEIEAIGRRGRKLVEERFDWALIGRDLERAYSKLGALGPPPRPLTVTAADEPHDSFEPAITVVVPTGPEKRLRRALLDGIAAQSGVGGVEIVVVDRGSPEPKLESLRGAGCRVLSVRGRAPNLGAALNAGAEAARGRILVFTVADAAPLDGHWLARLTVPFDHDQPPAAVQGGISRLFFEGATPHDPRFTRETARWREAHLGTELSLVNAAMKRETWIRFPFPPTDVFPDRAWQAIAADHQMLILSCLAALVRIVAPSGFGELVRQSIGEGRSLRRFGMRYTTADLAADLLPPRPGLDAEGRPTTPAIFPQAVLGVVRPAGLWLGARLGGRRPAINAGYTRF